MTRQQVLNVSVVLSALLTSSAYSLTINLVRVEDGGEFGFGFIDKAEIGSQSPNTWPPATLNGDYAEMNQAFDLAMDAAARWWRAAIRDDFTLDVRYGWSIDPALAQAKADTRSGERVNHIPAQAGELNRSRTTKAVIRFNGNLAPPWYIDSTPPENISQFIDGEEFVLPGDAPFAPGISWTENIAADPNGTPVTVNSGRTSMGLQLAGFPRFDLFSTALHELGHALGLDTATLPLPIDGRIELTGPRAFATPAKIQAVDIAGLHLNPLFYPNSTLVADGLPASERRFLSAVDILAVAQQGDWLHFNTNPLAAVPEPAAFLLATAGLFAIVSHRWRRC